MILIPPITIDIGRPPIALFGFVAQPTVCFRHSAWKIIFHKLLCSVRLILITFSNLKRRFLSGK